MGTLGDIATIALVGGIGYLALTKVNWNNLGGGETTIKIEPTTTTIKLPDNTTITPDDPLTIGDTTIKKFEVTTDPEENLTEIKEELEVPVNSTTTIAEIEELDDGRRILTEIENKNYDTTIDPYDVNPVDVGAKGIGNFLKDVGVLSSDWKYTGLNLKFLGL